MLCQSATQPDDIRTHCTRLATAPNPCTFSQAFVILQRSQPRSMESTKFTCKHCSTAMLNDRHYHSWKRSPKVSLTAEDAFGIVTGTEAPPNADATAQLREFRRRSRPAYSLIYVSPDETTRPLI